MEEKDALKSEKSELEEKLREAQEAASSAAANSDDLEIKNSVITTLESKISELEVKEEGLLEDNEQLKTEVSELR